MTVLIFLVIVGGGLGLAALASKLNRLSDKLEELERSAAKRSNMQLLDGRIRALESEILHMKGEAEVPPPLPVLPAVEVKEEVEIPIPVEAPLPQPAVVETSEPVRQPTVQLPPIPEPQRPSTVEAPPKPSRTREEWETFIGGKLLNRIGALALIIGIGFFLKYAFDRNWITETMRVLIGAAIGAGLLLWGKKLVKKGLAIFAQGLVGAGISILYLSVYAAFNFYHLVPQAIAFVLMSAVTALTIGQALKYNSLAVSFLGWAGGFLTPFLLSTGHANEVGLFTYIAVLDVGLIAVFVKKDAWGILEPFTFGATYLTYFLWYQKFYVAADLLLTVLFLSIFWGLFYALDVYRIIRSSSTNREIRETVAALNAILYYIAMYLIINPLHHEWMGFVTILIGAIYFLNILAIKRWRPIISTVFLRYILTAIALLIFATWVQFTGFTTVIYWSLEALALAWCGVHWKRAYVWIAAIGLFGLAVIKLFATDGAISYVPIQSFRLIFNERFLGFLVLAATLWTSTFLFKRLEEKTGPLIRVTVHYAWCLLLFILCTVEVLDYFNYLGISVKSETFRAYLSFNRMMCLAAVWMVYSLPLVWSGLRRNILPILYCGLGVLALSAIFGGVRGSWYDPIEYFKTILNSRAAALALILVGLVVHGWWLRKRRQAYGWVDQALVALQYTWCILLFILCSGETNDYFNWLMSSKPAGTEVSIGFNRLMTLSAIWMIYSLPVAWYGWREKSLPIVYCAFGALILSVVFGGIRGIWYEPIEYFKSILNSRAATLALILIGLVVHSWWLGKRRQAYGWVEQALVVLQYSGCAILFILCTFETNDYFRQIMLNQTGEMRAGLHFNRSMILAAVWVFYSLPTGWYGLRKNILSVLYCGLGVLGLSVLLGIVQGITFVPILNFTPLMNLRASVLVLIILGSSLHARWLRNRRQSHGWIEKALAIFQVVVVLLIFLLITGEILDFFGKAIFLLKDKTIASAGEFARLANLRHLSLSGSWLVYSIILLIIGIWRRIQRLRIIAIVLFGITILKIFIYDLSFLQTLYRIFSFVGLGVMLLATSYLYQRYKTFIFGAAAEKEPS